MKTQHFPQTLCLEFVLLMALAPCASASAGDVLEYKGKLSDAATRASSNGLHDFLFSLYDATEGGKLLWQESDEAVPVRDGSYSVMLGSKSPLDLPDGRYWLETAINGETLAPRSAFTLGESARTDCTVTGNFFVDGREGIGTTTPQSKLGVAGGAVIGASYASTSAAPSDGLLVQGYVGIGTTTPNRMLHVVAPNSGIAIRGESTGPAGTGVEGAADTGVSSIGVYGFAPEGAGVQGRSDSGAAVRGLSSDGIGVAGGSANGYAGYFTGKTYFGGIVGIGTTDPQNKLDVKGAAVIGTDYAGTNLAVPNGLLVEGAVGIGTTAPAARLDVQETAATGTGISGTSTTANGIGVFARADNGTGAKGIWAASTSGLAVYGQSTDGQGVYGQSTSGNGVYGVSSTGFAGYFTGKVYEAGNVGIGTTTPQNKLDVEGAAVIGPIYSGSIAAPVNGLLVQGNVGLGTATPQNKLDVGGGAVVGATYSGTNAAPANGLLVEGNVGLGTATPQNKLDVEGGAVIGATYSGTNAAPANGLLVEGQAAIGTSSPAAATKVTVTSSTFSNAIQSTSSVNNGTGMLGAANTGTLAYGVWGMSSSGQAAHFDGVVEVTGNLMKSGGGFKIDHPLDPANRYLYHSFVESPDMMNLYNGNVMLDEKGEATVTLPRWFEAVNRDFRYQLTAIGQPGPDLYVAQEVAGNQFRIAGGTPGMKVSWLVTGIRHDAFANAHRIPLEEDKPRQERGFFLHPDLFGQSEEKGIDWARKPEVMRQLKEQQGISSQAQP
jgi:hypothetical protein